MFYNSYTGNEKPVKPKLNWKQTMTYSHIFKARKESGYKFICYITATPALQGAPIESAYFDSKVAAKKYAAAKNAKAWNY